METTTVAKAAIIEALDTWQRIFLDGEGFHEKLSLSGAPLPVEYRRLHAAARLLFVFSRGSAFEPRFLRTAESAFSFLQRFRCAEDSSFVFKVDRNGAHLDPARDAYGHAFVLFGLAAFYEQTVDSEIRKLVSVTDAAVERIFFHHSFYRTRLSPEGRELLPGLNQNHHMHLFEAYLELFRVTKDEFFLERVLRILALFKTYWFHDDLVVEQLNEASRGPDENSFSEPGHSYEWAWLLVRLRETAQNTSDLETACALVGAADRNGWDYDAGGIFDELDLHGAPRKTSKRIWPLTEAVKAHLALYRATGDPTYRAGFEKFHSFLKQHYLLPGHLWREHLEQDLRPKTTELPVTTLYHLFLCMLEQQQAEEIR